MWLLPFFSRLSRLAARTFYRLAIAGERVPAAGPVLLVANHPNSLLDPALVAAAAGRPARFLAKAPLFADPQVGWLVRGSGAIPVFRPEDDRAQVGRNEEMFRAAHAALAGGAAVGIFPEGVSHSEPSLAPLRTGAARIALGAAALRGGGFPIVPLGLSFREKERFRSEALVLVGRPVAWDDLRAAGSGDAGAVRELTRRLDEALREITVNLERWEDAPLVEWAEEIHGAELGAAGDPTRRISRLREAAAALSRLRRGPDERWAAAARDVLRHGQLLRLLGLRAADLGGTPRLSAAVRWTARQLGFFLLAAPLAALGIALFYPPYRLTGVLEARARPLHDIRATYKLLAGAAAFLLWILLLAGLAAGAAGVAAGAAALVALPVVAIVTLAVRERWSGARADARRFLLLRGRRGLHRRLQARQRELAARLEALREEARVQSGRPDAPIVRA